MQCNKLESTKLQQQQLGTKSHNLAGEGDVGGEGGGSLGADFTFRILEKRKRSLVINLCNEKQQNYKYIEKCFSSVGKLSNTCISPSVYICI